MSAQSPLAIKISATNGTISGRPTITRRLSDLQGCFVDEAAFERAVRSEDAIVYGVSTWDERSGPNDLHLGVGTLQPGKVGREYYFTKGHYHELRGAAEIYVGLAGTGFLLLEREDEEGAELVPLSKDRAIYVPGRTAHRTINTGTEPLVYFGIYSAIAGHDYESLRERGFRHVVVDEHGTPQLRRRENFLHTLSLEHYR